MGRSRLKTGLKTALFVGLGLVVGSLFANFKSNDYRHASLLLKANGEVGPLAINDYSGRQVVALSLRNLQPATDFSLQGEGIAIQSWYPPALPLPFRPWLTISGGAGGEEFRVKGARFGQRLPLYLIVEAGEAGGCRELTIRNNADGALLRTVHLLPGGDNGGHH